MSRAFLKNESADDPVVIPARAPLPPGVPNYVTSRGLILLRAELNALEVERAQVQTKENDETERSRQLALLNGRTANLNQRIASAKVVNTHEHVQDGSTGHDTEVRFGATVSLQSQNAKTKNANQKLTIVGVDEADATHGRIAFTAPIARLMLGKRIGDLISLRTGQGENRMKIIAISYNE